MQRMQKPSSTGAFLALVACALIMSAPMSHAQTNPPHGKSSTIPEKKSDGTWENLSPTQQKTLAPLESDWDYMLPDSRKKWIYVSNIYPKMSTQDQERLQSRMASWSSLPQKDRRLARENYLSSLKFPAEKKAEAWSAYQKLSDEQKKKLADMEAKKKPNAINAPTLQQHAIKQNTTPQPLAPKPRSLPPENTVAPASADAQ